MGKALGARRDLAALEARRLEAIRLLEEEGLNQSEVARRLGVARQTVVRWVAQYRAHGRRGLRRAERAGRKPQLSATEKAKLVRLLERGPEALGYETPLWTCARVAHLIEQEVGVRYHPGHVWKILGSLGWSVPRPVGRAPERNEAAVRAWRRRRGPAIKKSPPAGAHDRLRRRMFRLSLKWRPSVFR